jgi:hypothetical protein
MHQLAPQLAPTCHVSLSLPNQAISAWLSPAEQAPYLAKLSHFWLQADLLAQLGWFSQFELSCGNTKLWG